MGEVVAVLKSMDKLGMTGSIYGCLMFASCLPHVCLMVSSCSVYIVQAP